MRAEIIVQGPYLLVIPDVELDEQQTREVMHVFHQKTILVLPPGRVLTTEVNVDDL